MNDETSDVRNIGTEGAADAASQNAADAATAEEIREVDRLEAVTPTKARMDAAERSEHRDAERRSHHGDPTNGVYSGLDTIAFGGH
ncbi:hypothetical protein G1C96_1930 [Bifidobacterium sp. DSM 109958]|uniref:Uncharacterized protein n=1 Tax=Bifidobacterium moraviense TaxID=2675323 RepID=A0A7Y0F3H2_9BIFI|nr:hypothetical protein [Bifidobacterium sp. DSM 109958]NMN01340.1 hypothetical protein [Bifidobacterium sp. DSM 109958]